MITLTGNKRGKTQTSDGINVLENMENGRGQWKFLLRHTGLAAKATGLV